MKIESLFVSNFLGATAVDVRTPEPIQLFAGRNGAGKSSLRDAIALALTGELGRVGLKKEAGQLIHTGADAAVCQLATADGTEYQVSISGAGKIHDTRAGRDADPALHFVLDAQSFARLGLTERREFLYGLMGIKLEPAVIHQRLLGRLFAGVKPTEAELRRIERIEPLLRAGFDAAAKEARAKATEAKGAWRAVTTETYGSEKAKFWHAHVPPFDAKIAAGFATELQHCDVALEQWQQAVGKLVAEEQRRAVLRAKLPALQEHAAKIARLQAKLATDEASLAEWEADLSKTAAAAGAGPRVGLVHDLARAIDFALPAWPNQEQVESGWQGMRDALTAYEAEHGKIGTTGGDAKAQARLPSVRNSRDLLANSVAHAKRDVQAAQTAKAEVDSIGAELAEVFDAAALSDARDQADKLKAQRAEIVKKVDAQKSIKALVDGAETKAKQAAQHAADVAAWDAIAEALGPDGIPADILAEALGPINTRLAQAEADTGWPRVLISADMTITGGARDYRLLSESERWRVDAMLAEAISHLSGARLLVLDGFDVLDLQGRSDLLSWLDALADAGEIDTALIFGTLKAAPANLPSTIGAHWLQDGVCAQLKEAA